jgi:threonine/homoserine/homoserine lactone efflux protein
MIVFLIQTVILSLTGVMAPGPITAATLGSGTRSPFAGLMVAVGHGIVEIPLMVAIYYGMGNILEVDAVRAVVFTLGGVFLLLMGTGMLRGIPRAAEIMATNTGSPFTIGIMLSMGNVYFLLWWATVGASLITKAVGFGLVGVLGFSIVHWLCDAIWLTTLSSISYRGGRRFGVRFQQVVAGICGTFLLIFAVLFLRDALHIFA